MDPPPSEPMAIGTRRADVAAAERDGLPVPEPVRFERPVQEKRAAKAERELTLLGKVNPLALEEFGALEERYKFLSEQLEDLQATRRDLLTVIASMRARPGKEQDLRDALEALIAPTTQEAGYVNHDLHQGVEDPAVFFFYENWESGDALDAHLAAPHLQQILTRLDELLEGELSITRLRRIA